MPVIALLIGGLATPLIQLAIPDSPADIHQEIIPKIAAELIHHGETKLLQNQTISFSKIMGPDKEDIGFRQENLPTGGSETGISFFRKSTGDVFLWIGLMLHKDRKSYRIWKYIENPE